MRHDGREPHQLRDIRITPHFTDVPLGSALVEFGKTRVLCTASVEDRVPKWLVGAGSGWVTAEYGMLPGSTQTRKQRSLTDGRNTEIQRLLGRSLRSVVDMHCLGERTLWLDCDVLQADGGTRTAAITGAYVALALAIDHLWNNKQLLKYPLCGQVAAVSVGVVKGQMLLDLDYNEDSNADVDMNVVATDKLQLVEVQATAEKQFYSRAQLDTLLDLAAQGCQDLFALQNKALGKK